MKRSKRKAERVSPETYTRGGRTLPVLRGRLVPYDQLSPSGNPHECWLLVLCSGCGWEHAHGWDSRYGGEHLEYRNAHCPPGTPLHETGYFVSVLRPGDPGCERHEIEPGNLQGFPIEPWTPPEAPASTIGASRASGAVSPKPQPMPPAAAAGNPDEKTEPTA